MNKILKLLFGIFLLVSAASLSLFVYGANTSTSDKAATNKLSTTNQSLIIDVASFNTTDKLVPAGKAIFKGQTEVITLTYTVDVSSFNDGSYRLYSKAINIQIDNQSTYNDLVQISINNQPFNNQTTIHQDQIEVTVEIRLNEPKDFEAYQAVHGKNITFQLLFEVI